MLLLLLIVFALFTPLSADTGSQDLPTLAVIDFENSGVDTTVSLLISDRLRTEIFKTGTVRLIDRGMMAEILQEQGFQQSGCTSEECMVQLGQMLGVKEIIGGRIYRLGKLISVSARRVSVENGEILAAATFDSQDSYEFLIQKGIPTLIQQLMFKVAAKEKTIPEPVAESKQTSEASSDPGVMRFSPFQLSLITPLQLIPRKFAVFGISINTLYGQNVMVGGISAGLINHTKNGMYGISAGLINTSPRVIGLQAGLINVTDRLTGLQVGLINVVRGRKRVPLVPIINVGF